VRADPPQFDVFQGHFSTDLPFIHPPTFSKPLRHAAVAHLTSDLETDHPTRPPATDEFLLAFLALTARFHSKLVTHYASLSPDDPRPALAASEAYASLARDRLVQTFVNRLEEPDLEQIQSLLMLTFYEWTVCRGSQAWKYLGLATRAAHTIGLHYQSDLDYEATSCCLEPSLLRTERQLSGLYYGADGFVKQEIRRRTMWSCYLLERYMSNGRYRLACPENAYHHVQLPASERAFLFDDPVQTLLFGNDRNSSRTSRYAIYAERCKTISEVRRRNLSGKRFYGLSQGRPSQEEPETSPERDSLNGLYVDVMSIFCESTTQLCKKYDLDIHEQNRHADASFYSGSKADLQGPQKQLDDFFRSLPRQYQLSSQNTSAHTNLRTSSSYSLIHFVALICQILLARQSLPLCALRHDRLADRDAVSTSDYTSQVEITPASIPQAWPPALAACCDASRKINELAQSCQEWNVLVETPIVAFALYLSAFVRIYAVYYPWLVSDRSSVEPISEVKTCFNLLERMKPRSPVATQWMETLLDFEQHLYTMRIRHESEAASHMRHAGLDIEGHDRDWVALVKFVAGHRVSDDSLHDSMLRGRIAPDPIKRRASITLDSELVGLGGRSTAGGSVHDHATTNPKREDGASMETSDARATSQQTSPALSAATQNHGSFRSYGSYIDQASPSDQRHTFRPLNSSAPTAAATERLQTGSTSGWTATNGHDYRYESSQARETLPGIHTYANMHGHSRSDPSANSYSSTNQTASMPPPPAPAQNAEALHQHTDRPTNVLDHQSQLQTGHQRTASRPDGTASYEKSTPDLHDLHESESTVLLTADDLSAFVEGVNVREWARQSAEARPRFQGDDLGPGWLSLVHGFK